MSRLGSGASMGGQPVFGRVQYHTAGPDELRAKLRRDIMMVELQEQEQPIYHRAASSTTPQCTTKLCHRPPAGLWKAKEDLDS